MSYVLQEKDEEDSKKESIYSKINLLIKNLNEKTSINTLKKINSKCVDLMLEEKYSKALEFLKDLESFLENEIMDMEISIPKKLLIIILNNISCCYENLKDLDNCLLYFEALIYHYDSLIEKQYNIAINPEYFDTLLKSKYYFVDNKNLGYLILELRFCAKFHIQYSILLSKTKKHVDSLYHAKLAALICEDNLIKMNYLYHEIKYDFANNKIKENGSNSELNELKELINQNCKIVFALKNIAKNLRNNSPCEDNNKIIKQDCNRKNKINLVYNNYFKYVNNTQANISRQSSNYEEKSQINKNDTNKKNCFNSYLDFRENKIDIYTKDKKLLKEIKNIFEKKFLDEDDWIKNLKVESITDLSPSNYEDLDLESNPKYELLRDSLLEKVIMFTVSYYCLSNELRFLSPDKNNHNTNGEYYLYNALYISLYLLPPGCPIVNHYLISYYKNYKQCLDIIPEGKIMNYNIDIFRKEIFNKNHIDFNDYSYFVKAKRINMKLNEEKSFEKNETQEKEGNISCKNNDSKNKNRTKLIKKNSRVINDFNKRKKIFYYKSNCLNNNKKKKIISISDNNIFNNKKYDSNSISVSNSLTSKNTSSELDIKNIKLIYDNIGLLPNNNYIERAKKSKIQKIIVPKFEIDLNKINQDYNMTEIGNTENKAKDSIKDHITNNIKKKKFLSNKIFKINKKNNISDRKGNLNNNINKNNINDDINKNEKKKINLEIKNILKNEKLNNNNKSLKIFGYKIDNKNLNNNINNMNKKRVFNNQLTKLTNSNSFKLNNKKKFTKLVKYFRINNISNKDKECLTERLNININNKNQISLSQN